MSTPATTDAPAVTKTLFTDGWLFRSLDSDVAVAVQLPHDAMIGEPRSAEAETGNHGGYFPGGAYLYTKSWDVPADADTRVISLLFEGVYGATVVRINGQQVAKWDSGYRETVVPISPYITAGERALIEVSVDNTRTPNARWYTGSGIYRPVWLQNTALVRFARDGVHVVTRSIADPAQLDVTVHIDGPALGAKVTVDVLDAGVVIGAGSALVEEAGAVVTVDVPSPRAWSAEDPHLYEIAVALVDDESTADEHRERIGLRTVSIDASTGLRINGKHVNLRGACVHHDNGILGAATHAAAEYRRAQILKENGFNAIRSAHNPLSRAFLDACDELGLYVMDELTDTWYQHKTAHDPAAEFDANWRQDIDSMVAKDRNRASVIMYSIGNEVAETASARGIRTTRDLAAYTRSADPERPTTLALNFLLNVMASFGASPFRPEKHEPAKKTKPKSAATSTAANALAAKAGSLMQQIARLRRADKFSRDALAEVDVAGYNYAFLRYAGDRKRYPNRVIVGSESMPGDIARIWKLVETIPGVIGDFMWTGWDYLGEAGLGSWSYDSNAGINKAYPELLAGTGAIDILGLPGAPALLAQAVWGQLNAPAVAVRPLDRAGQRTQTTPWRSSDAIASWSWAGYDGTTAQIEIYTADDEVELLLNGRSLGRKPAGQAAGFVTRFETPYRPGTLTAVGYRDNQETARSQLHSASSPRLTLRPERARISGDENFWFVWIELADDHGVVDTGSHDELKIEVRGEATLAALGNAAPATTESFTDRAHDTYYGRAMAIVRGPIDAQNVQLTARSRRHGDVSIQLTPASADDPARTNGGRSLRDADTAGALR